MKKSTVTLLVIAISLSACSSAHKGAPSGVGMFVGLVKEKIALGRKKRQTPPAAPVLKRAALAGIKSTLVLAHLEKNNAYGALSLAASNGGYQSLVSADKRMLILKDGVLVETRGLAGDLMESDSAGLSAALKHPRRAVSFSHMRRWLNGENHKVTARYSCKVKLVGNETIGIVERKYPTRHVREICTDSARTFQNDFWISRRDGKIWQSRQWIGPVPGYISLQVLVP